jgi:hypothetical protein
MSKARRNEERRHSECDWDVGGPAKPSFRRRHEAVFRTVIGEAGATPGRPNDPEEVDGC